MIWKPKEKELTEEEAIALARRELAPHWHGSSPLFAPVKTPDHISLHPIDKRFKENGWLLIFVDPTTLTGENVFLFIKEMHQRYIINELHLLVIFRPSYHYLTDARTIERFVRTHQIPVPVVIDHDLSIAAALEVKSYPTTVLIAENTIHGRHAGDSCEWMKEVEVHTQQFLRSRDPGLPLLNIWDPSVVVQGRDIGRIDFGKGRSAKYPAPGFINENKGVAYGKFTQPYPEHLPVAPEGFYITGQWVQDGDRIATSDPKAQLSFISPSPGVSLIAQSLAKVEPARVIVELNNRRTQDAFNGKDLVMDDDGQAVLRLEAPKLYKVLNKLPDSIREVTFHFPFANEVSLAIFGVRFHT